jgi:dihydroorotate dehydrogenase
MAALAVQALAKFETMATCKPAMHCSSHLLHPALSLLRSLMWHISAHACRRQSSSDLADVVERFGSNVYVISINVSCLRFIHVGPCHKKPPALDAVSDTLLADVSSVAMMRPLLLARASQIQGGRLM